jgi:multidrug efflux pump subunit AcrA (membrane-fusion protein)
MDEKTRTLPVVVEVDDNPGHAQTGAGGRLRPGLFVNVQIKGKEVRQVFVIPRYTVHAGNLVYIVRENRLSVRPVTILRRYNDTVFVEDGLNDGDLLVTTPLSGATEGMKIRLRSEDGGQRTEDG